MATTCGRGRDGWDAKVGRQRVVAVAATVWTKRRRERMGLGLTGVIRRSRKLQNPRTKIEKSSKFQVPRSRKQRLSLSDSEVAVSLELGTWSFSRSWFLMFGAS